MESETAGSASWQAPPFGAQGGPRLPGDLVVWLLVLVELLTFGILFGTFAITRLREATVFRTGQAGLDLSSGAINTLLLIGASWCAARAVHALRGSDDRSHGGHADASRSSARWLVGALVCGCGFLLNKSLEYAHMVQRGLDVADNSFDLLYLMLTGFHFLHAAVGCVLFALVWWPTRQGAYPAGNCHTLETVAVFWHMVDLLWMLLFPLVYVLR